MLLIDVRPFGLTGSKVQLACDQVSITLNKNTIVKDKSALTPGGLRVGTCAVTTRGYTKEDITKVAEYLDRIIRICVEVQKESGKKLVDFKKGLDSNEQIAALKSEVETFGRQFPIPMFDL